MNLQTIVPWMMENGYLLTIKGKYRLTAKFNGEMSGKYLGVMKATNGSMTVLEESSQLPVVASQVKDWPQLFLQFIKEAEVPSKGEGRMNMTYDINKYSEEGMKAFRKMMESGVRYEVLVKSTMLYYKTRKAFPVKIGNYISDGAWRSDYEALLSSAGDGTLIEHIQKEIDDNTEFSRFKLG